MANVVIYPDKETKRTARRLAKYLKAETIYTNKVSKKETSRYENYDNIFFGYTMIDHKRSKVLSEFCYLNKNRLKNMPSVLFCPLHNPLDVEVMEKFVRTISAFVKKYQQQVDSEKRMVVCSLSEKDKEMVASVSHAVGISSLNLRSEVVEIDTTSVIIVFYKTDTSMPLDLMILLDPLVNLLHFFS